MSFLRPYVSFVTPPILVVLCLGAASAATSKDTLIPAEARFAKAADALNAGDMHAAESLFTAAPQGAPRHDRKILSARLAASRGDWKRTDSVLRAWNDHPARARGSGEILFWQGWSALHQGRIAQADSLLVLASAYAGGNRAQDALEYRFFALLENPPVLQEYLRGLPESPLPSRLRSASLKRVPEESRLRPYALWHLALLLERQEGEAGPASAMEILRTLAANAETLPGRRAAARLAFLREKTSPDSALSDYESLLLQHQQGIPSEFARERIQKLRETDVQQR